MLSTVIPFPPAFPQTASDQRSLLEELCTAVCRIAVSAPVQQVEPPTSKTPEQPLAPNVKLPAELPLSKDSIPSRLSPDPGFAQSPSDPKPNCPESGNAKLSNYRSGDTQLSGHRFDDTPLNSTDHRVSDLKFADHEFADAKSTTHRFGDPKLGDHRFSYPKLGDHQFGDTKSTTHRFSDPKLSDHRFGETELSGHQLRDTKVSDRPFVDTELNTQPFRDTTLSDPQFTDQKLCHNRFPDSKSAIHPFDDTKLGLNEGTFRDNDFSVVSSLPCKIVNAPSPVSDFHATKFPSSAFPDPKIAENSLTDHNFADNRGSVHVELNVSATSESGDYLESEEIEFGDSGYESSQCDGQISLTGSSCADEYEGSTLSCDFDDSFIGASSYKRGIVPPSAKLQLSPERCSQTVAPPKSSLGPITSNSRGQFTRSNRQPLRRRAPWR
jgi:hypothetical protein